jgi:hypothetical protein
MEAPGSLRLSRRTWFAGDGEEAQLFTCGVVGAAQAGVSTQGGHYEAICAGVRAAGAVS